MWIFLKKLMVISTIVWLLFSCESVLDVTKPDTTPPTLVLVKQADTIVMGEIWTNPPAAATDDVDLDVSSQVKITGKVKTGMPGLYPIIYSVSDQAGNESRDTMTVYVKLDPNTVAWYPLSIDVKDYSGNNFDGTIVGKDSLTADRYGNLSSARHFNGVSYSNMPYQKAMDFSGAFTISVWAKSDIASISGDAFVLNMGFGAERDYGIYYNPTNGMVFRYNSKIVNSKSVLDIQNWHHYAMVFTGDSLKGFVDGKLVGSLKTGVGAIDDYPFRIASESKKDERFWKGCIDDVLLLKVKYNDTQILGLADNGAFRSDTTGQVTTPTDTSHQTVTATVTNLKATISGTSGNLTMKLTWDAVPNAFSYSVYFNTGKVVTTNDYFRVAVSNSKTFTTELTEGAEYTFAVAYVINSVESALSTPLTVVIKP